MARLQDREEAERDRRSQVPPACLPQADAQLYLVGESKRYRGQKHLRGRILLRRSARSESGRVSDEDALDGRTDSALRSGHARARAFEALAQLQAAPGLVYCEPARIYPKPGVHVYSRYG